MEEREAANDPNMGSQHYWPLPFQNPNPPVIPFASDFSPENEDAVFPMLPNHLYRHPQPPPAPEFNGGNGGFTFPFPAMVNPFQINPQDPNPDHYNYQHSAFQPESGQLNGRRSSGSSSNSELNSRSSNFGSQYSDLQESLELELRRLNLSSSSSSSPFINGARTNSPARPSNFNAGNISMYTQVPLMVNNVQRDTHRLNPYRVRENSRPRTKFPDSLYSLSGMINSVARHQEGCRYLQKKCEEGRPEDINLIFFELKDHILELMVDGSMNYLVQKLFLGCHEKQITYVVLSVVGDNRKLLHICLDPHGTRSVQKLIEHLKTGQQKKLMVAALRKITYVLAKNMNGYHVIQHCLKLFDVDEVQPIMNVLAENCYSLAVDRNGCCVLQHSVTYATGSSQKQILVDIISNALSLSHNPFGNYVVQHVLGMQIPFVTDGILRQLSGNHVSLSLTKHGSPVVEKCMKEAQEKQFAAIVKEMIQSQDFLSICQSPYGNFVAQTALKVAKGYLKEALINRIQKEYPNLHSHMHGKRVVQAALTRNHRRF